MLSKEMTKYKDKPAGGQYDPYYVEIPHPTKPNKTKKVKRQIPAYIPQEDAEILARARKTAYRLDYCLFNFLGFRFGWSSVIALVPAIGDALDGLMALMLVRRMGKVKDGLPWGTASWMIIWIVIDILVGLVPFVGDLADASLKANSRNVRMLEEHLDKKYKPRDFEEDKRIPKEDRRPATVYEDFSDDDIERLNAAIHNSHDDVRQPNRAYSPGRRERLPDEEMGIPKQEKRTGRTGRTGR